MNKFEQETKEKYGHTKAYKEYSKKKYSEDEQNELNIKMDKIMEEFSICAKENISYDSKEVIELVEKLQNHISSYYYTCTDEILYCLGNMYVADNRFKENIDKHYVGTALYIKDAITHYLQK